MTYVPNIPLEMLRALLVIAGWYVLFYRRHRPASKLWRIVLLALFPTAYTGWMLCSVSGVPGNEICWLAIIFLFALLCGDILESLFTAIFYLGMEACLDSIVNFGARYILGENIPLYSPAYNAISILLYLMVLGWTLYYYWVVKTHQGRLPKAFGVMMTISPLGSTVLLTFFAQTAGQVQETMGINIYLIGILLAFFLLVMNLLIFSLYFYLLGFYESHLQTQILYGQMDLYTRQIKFIETGHERTQVVRHEMKNLLLILQSAIKGQDYEEALKRISAVVGELNEGTVKFYTGFTIIDLMLSYKAESLQDYGATLAVHATDLKIAGEVIYDIAAMLAIMMDNATEAAAIAAAGTPPFAIRGDIQQKNHIVVITFTNPLSIPLNYSHGEIVSTKAESGHGFGIRSLRLLAKKYGGTIEITDTDGLFSMKILLILP
jgi:hypothetical protein